ncbi:hypothetical protein Pla8534_19040 [Lignipirellula cremea]|uniref:Trypsin-like peptidase domain-containing protein n=2 Tax=Lignipirellula cremea TaxID=2528010 RepID=A0A518DQK3_9BACT|nr:hypothetical protein Pla8534_19040 [Lignipirellula cremea]
MFGGIALINGVDHKIGTLGFSATADDNSAWIVSCFHVLYPSTRRLNDNEHESIYQPSQSRRQTPIAQISNERTDDRLDIAAARLTFGLPSRSVLNLGKTKEPVLAERGMRVVKSGAKTGVTEGIVMGVSDELVVIGRSDDTPEGYVISDIGDSGSLWLRADDLAPVALHFEGNSTGAEWAKARPIGLVLETLQLKLVNE